MRARNSMVSCHAHARLQSALGSSSPRTCSSCATRSCSCRSSAACWLFAAPSPSPAGLLAALAARLLYAPGTAVAACAEAGPCGEAAGTNRTAAGGLLLSAWWPQLPAAPPFVASAKGMGPVLDLPAACRLPAALLLVHRSSLQAPLLPLQLGLPAQPCVPLLSAARCEATSCICACSVPICCRFTSSCRAIASKRAPQACWSAFDAACIPRAVQRGRWLVALMQGRWIVRHAGTREGSWTSATPAVTGTNISAKQPQTKYSPPNASI